MTSRHSSLGALVAALLCLWLGPAGRTGAARSRVLPVGELEGALESFPAIPQRRN